MATGAIIVTTVIGAIVVIAAMATTIAKDAQRAIRAVRTPVVLRTVAVRIQAVPHMVAATAAIDPQARQALVQARVQAAR